MFQKKRNGIFFKYFATTSAIMLSSFLVMGVTLLWFFTNYWADKQIELLQTNADSYAKKYIQLQDEADLDTNLSREDEIKVNQMFAIIVLGVIQESLNADVFVCNESGRVIYCYDMLSNQNPSAGQCRHSMVQVSGQTLEQVKNGTMQTRGKLDGAFEKNHFLASAPLVLNGKFLGAVFLTQPVTQEMLPIARSVSWLFFVAAFIALAIAFVAFYVMTYRMTKPLRDMSRAAKQYAMGDFSRRISYHRFFRRKEYKDELGELVQDFNSMAGALATLESMRRSFVANVSHELKTPMTTIGGFIDGILDGTIDQSRQKQYLKIVSSEVKRLSRLVTSMLNMSKIEAGELQLNPKRFDIARLMFQTLLAFEQEITNKHITINGFERMGTVNVLADEDMIHQVVYNLIDNAVKFVNEDGQITLAASANDTNYTISIRNSGAGIPPEEVGNIFERFYKVDKSRSYDVRSAGLGLYIVKSIVELHGGTISVESEMNRYTEFRFTLPRAGALPRTEN